MTLLAAAVALFSLRYLSESGPRAPEILANLYADPWLKLHVAGACAALMIGSLQFIANLRRLGIHRWIGRFYALACLVGGIAGIQLAFGSTAGPIAGAGFGLLGITWLASTAQGVRHAFARRFDDHRVWMIRSWSLTLAAVTLRIYLPLIQPLGFEFIDGYRAISFLCWVPNLLVAELVIRMGRRRAFAVPRSATAG